MPLRRSHRQGRNSASQRAAVHVRGGKQNLHIAVTFRQKEPITSSFQQAVDKRLESVWKEFRLALVVKLHGEIVKHYVVPLKSEDIEKAQRRFVHSVEFVVYVEEFRAREDDGRLISTVRNRRPPMRA